MHREHYAGGDRLADRPGYKAIERTLWVIAPGLILLLASSIPAEWAARRQEAAALDKAAALENSFYCEKWGMPAGTFEHANCVRDLVGIRARSERRVRDQIAGDFV